MKKFMVLLLSLSLLLALAACGGSASTDDGGSDADAASSNTASDTQVSENTAEETEAAFEEMAVVDNDQCAITITGIDPDNIWGYTLEATLENKSSDTTYMFAIRNASVNGVDSDPFFASEVAAGKKANVDISFTDSTLEENGIVDYTDIKLTFYVYDSDDWTAENVAEETVHVYPDGEENAVAYVREAQESDIVLVDNDYASVIVTGYEHDDIWGYTVNLFFVNKTDTDVMFSVENASVNGYMIDPFYATEVSAGSCAFSSMSWYDEDLEENGITQVEELEFELVAYDNNDWTGEYFVDDVITLNTTGESTTASDEA